MMPRKPTLSIKNVAVCSKSPSDVIFGMENIPFGRFIFCGVVV